MQLSFGNSLQQLTKLLIYGHYKAYRSDIPDFWLPTVMHFLCGAMYGQKENGYNTKNINVYEVCMGNMWGKYLYVCCLLHIGTFYLTNMVSHMSTIKRHMLTLTWGSDAGGLTCDHVDLNRSWLSQHCNVSTSTHREKKHGAVILK